MADLEAFYRLQLQKELDSRIAKNSKYSRNAFAKFLGMTPSYFSKLMKGTILLSLEIADKATKKLNLNKKERDDFLLSVAEEQMCHALYLIDPDLTACQADSYQKNILPSRVKNSR